MLIGLLGMLFMLAAIVFGVTAVIGITVVITVFVRQKMRERNERQ